RGQGERVRGRAVEYKEDLAAGLEEVPNHLGGLGRPFVIAVAADVSSIGLEQGSPRLWADACIIVAGELPAFIRTITHHSLRKSCQKFAASRGNEPGFHPAQTAPRS